MITLAILGASGHGKVVADIALATGQYNNVIFFDEAWPEKICNGKYTIAGALDALVAFAKTERVKVSVAIGNNNIRSLKIRQLRNVGLEIATVIHPSAIIATSTVIGTGCVIMPGVVINADVSIGDGAIVNTNAVVEHDCCLGEAVHISPSAALAGGVRVGDFSWVGMGAVVIQLVAIGNSVVVGAGAAVVEDIPDNSTAVGVPAKVIKREGKKC